MSTTASAARSLSALALLGLLATAPEAARATAFRFPLSTANCAATPTGDCYVTAYYDLDRGGGLRDWNCGNNTYNNHSGTDYGVGSFPGMDMGVDVVAAAAGEVIGTHDGEFDRCTSADCGDGNYVHLRHADGKLTLYYHLKKFTVAVNVGDQVACGQKLGQVGSSGRSTGPHLHFQVNVNGAGDDPYAAVNGCGGPLSYWVSQGGYNGLPGACCEDGCYEPPRDDAEYAGQDPADDLHRQPGERFTMRFRVRNTGTTTWTRGERYLLTRDGDEPGDPRIGGPEQIELAEGESVPPGAEKEFAFELEAPRAPGGPYRAWFKLDRFGTARFGQRFYIQLYVDPAVDGDGDGSTSADGDCNDGDPSVHPGAPDGCDGVDRDCDGDVDGDAEPLSCETSCGPGEQRCEGGVYGACIPPVAGLELCNGLDDDCDGSVDEGDELCPAEQRCLGGVCTFAGGAGGSGGGGGAGGDGGEDPLDEDAGEDPEAPLLASAEGCGCATVPGSSAWWLTLAPLLLRRRRR